MMEKLVTIEKNDGIAIVTMNRPEVLNAMSSGLMYAMQEGFKELKADRSIGVAIVTGAGRAFSVGLDLKEISAITGSMEDSDIGKSGAAFFKAVADFDRPVIGAINGIAVTMGFELALLCDFLIASDNARFADTHVRIGIIPGAGISQKLSRIISIGRAKQLSLTGEFLSAEKAERWGLVNEVVPEEQLIPRCMKYARVIQNNEQRMVCAYKKLMDDGYQQNLVTALEIEKRAHLADAKESAARFDENRMKSVQETGRQQK